MVREAAKGSARIIVTTECALGGYLMTDDMYEDIIRNG
jgi:predicted amidohydrolase